MRQIRNTQVFAHTEWISLAFYFQFGHSLIADVTSDTLFGIKINEALQFTN